MLTLYCRFLILREYLISWFNQFCIRSWEYKMIRKVLFSLHLSKKIKSEILKSQICPWDKFLMFNQLGIYSILWVDYLNVKISCCLLLQVAGILKKRDLRYFKEKLLREIAQSVLFLTTNGTLFISFFCIWR